MEEAYIHTPIGTACIRGDREGIASIHVEDSPLGEEVVPPSLKAACQQLREYFTGQRREFDLKLCPKGTPFQKKVWGLLREVPFGATLSYRDLASRLGQPEAVRAVAAANAKNPLWIVVPCHRILASDGSLHGYAWGLHRKRWLLNHENPAPQSYLFAE